MKRGNLYEVQMDLAHSSMVIIKKQRDDYLIKITSCGGRKGKGKGKRNHGKSQAGHTYKVVPIDEVSNGFSSLGLLDPSPTCEDCDGLSVGHEVVDGGI
ncbi:hypothetical protein L1987_49414 [Smallanthus sonchifolius]|uniref:Uncharacterized protein n=1 Tax=Smallanthus sonchifolius TaxID=185202 RepID=A0ACB9FWA7_9ASTR|nr:hypothetical protein L1987_49414 [Smallanthus sonchifolius]